MCLAQGHNTVTPVGIEPRTSRFGVRRSTTTPSPPCFDFTTYKINKKLSLRSFKSSEQIHEKRDGLGYLSLISDPLDLATWDLNRITVRVVNNKPRIIVLSKRVGVGGLNRFYRALTSTSSSAVVHNIQYSSLSLRLLPVLIKKISCNQAADLDL